MGKDYNPGEDVMVEFPVDMEYLREYRIKAVSYKDEESKFSRIVPVKRDHVSGEFYLEALYPIYTYQVRLRWSEAKGAPGYVIECKEKETDKWETIGQVGDWSCPSFTARELRPEKTYTFRVKTSSNAENVITSNEITVTTPDIFNTLKELSGIHAAEGDGMVTLIWNKTYYNVNNKKGVDIERSDEQGGRIKIAENIVENNYVDTGLNNGTTYTYYLTPVEKQGTDVKTSVISATPRKDNFIHIPFSDGHGLTAKDIHGNQDAQIHGSFKWEKNDREEFDAVTLNAQHYSYLSVPIDKLIGLEEYTMLLQFTIPDGEEGPVFYLGTLYKTGGYMHLMYRQEAPATLHLGLCGDYAAPVNPETDTKYYDIPCPAQHENIQFALIRNRDELKIFINGESGLHLNPYGFPPVYSGNTMFNLGMTPSIGDYTTSTGEGIYSSFTFEDLRIYNRALSEDEIRKLRDPNAIEEITSEDNESYLMVNGGRNTITVTTSTPRELIFYSIDGKMVRKEKISAAGCYEFDHFAPGVYLVEGRKIYVR